MHFGKTYIFSNQYIKMPALIRKVKWRNVNKPHLIFYIHAEFTLLRNSIYTSIFPFISILELFHQSNNI